MMELQTQGQVSHQQALIGSGAMGTQFSPTALANIEQSRAVMEVQAALVLARANPRQEHLAEQKILNSCKRKSLADCASYSFKRGGKLVTGSSIRLAETLARCWGNINYGFREIGRGQDYSEVEAFAHDLETNVRVTRQFQVKHWRDKRSGGEAITSERDKYEFMASQAQRRVRACLLELIPGDIVEMAEDACRATLERSIGDIEKKKDEIIATFAQFQVTKEDIERYLQRSLDSLVPADVVNLQRIYRSIKDGVATPAEFFAKKTHDRAEELNSRFEMAAPDSAPAGQSKTKAPVRANARDKKATKPAPVQKNVEESAPEPEGEEEKYSKTLQRFLEAMRSRQDSEKLDSYLYANQNTFEAKLTKEEIEILQAAANEHRAFLKQVQENEEK